MSSRITTFLLTIGLIVSGVILALNYIDYRVPGNQQGYEPIQPIVYSHRLHAGELEVDCLYCHFGAQQSRHAGIPPTSVCMNCHNHVTTSLGALRAEDELAQEEGRKPRTLVSPELAKLYQALGLGDDLQPDPQTEPDPIAWVKVHNLPDFVYFDHRPHLNAGVRCQRCHGPVETMERMRQFEDLSMGWCVNCHREANQTATPLRPVDASIDCVTCHY